MFRFVFLSVALILAGSVPAIAQPTGRQVSGSCHQGLCWATYVLGQRMIHQNSLGGVDSKLYKVNVEYYKFDMETQQVYSDDASSGVNWVYCSTREPFVAFESSWEPPNNDGLMIIHYINPGGETANYNRGSHRIYWAICHDDWDINVFEPEKGAAHRAAELGYITELLDARQHTISKVMFNVSAELKLYRKI
jgi:hypothetical protein